MKKHTIQDFVAALVILLLVVACGAPTAQLKEPEQPAKESTAPLGDPFEGRSPEEARAHFKAEIEKNPSDPLLWNALGVACYRLRDLECTEEALIKGRSLDPTNVGIISSLGMLRHRQKRNEEAKTILVEALKLNPDYGPAHNNMGLVLLDSQDLKGARASFERALEIRPNDLVAMENIGLLLLYHIREAKEARVHLEKRVRILQENQGEVSADNFRDVGVAALFSGDADGAIAFLTQAQEMEPNRADLTFNLGLAYMEVMELGRAVALLKKAFEQEPRYPLHAHFYGRLLAKMKEYDEAINVLGVAILVDPEDSEAHNALGICLTRSGKANEAEKSFQTACKLGLASACSNR